MVVPWFKRRRRRRLRSQPFPDTWQRVLQRNLHQYSNLSNAERAKLQGDVQILVAEKNWEGCAGQAIDEQVQVTIASQVALMTLGMKDEYFDMVLSILVYPAGYLAPEKTVIGTGVVLEGEAGREGEAWYRGPVVLSWPEVLAGGQSENGGHNLVIHEFAHQLDMQNGRVADGVPLVANPQQAERWHAVIDGEYRRLVMRCQQGRPTVLDYYGATHIAELFAVACEQFFQRPRLLEQYHGELYGLLRDYFGQDPVRWGARM